MKHPLYDDKVEQLRSQLKARIDTAARSFAEVLYVVSDLLIEIVQQKAAPTHEKPEKVVGRPGRDLLTTQEAAEYLDMKASTLTVWRCKRRYDIPFVKIGSGVRYRKSDLDKFIERRTKGSHDES